MRNKPHSPIISKRSKDTEIQLIKQQILDILKKKPLTITHLYVKYFRKFNFSCSCNSDYKQYVDERFYRIEIKNLGRFRNIFYQLYGNDLVQNLSIEKMEELKLTKDYFTSNPNLFQVWK